MQVTFFENAEIDTNIIIKNKGADEETVAYYNSTQNHELSGDIENNNN